MGLFDDDEVGRIQIDLDIGAGRSFAELKLVLDHLDVAISAAEVSGGRRGPLNGTELDDIVRLLSPGPALRPREAARAATVAVESVTYANPVEIVIAAGAAGPFVLALLRTIRDWSSDREMASLEVDRARSFTYAYARQLEDGGLDSLEPTQVLAEEIDEYGSFTPFRTGFNLGVVRRLHAWLKAVEPRE